MYSFAFSNPESSSYSPYFTIDLKRLSLHIPRAAEIPFCPCVKAWPPAETCSPTRPTFYGNSSPSQWTNAPAEPHTDKYTHKNACTLYWAGDRVLCECAQVCHWTVTNTQPGSPMASVQTAKLCELRSLLFTPRDNNVTVLSLFPSFPLIPSLHALSLFHPSFPRCTSSPGWPSATSTPCPAWLSPSGWPWCLGRLRRTSSAATSWGSCLC